MMSSTPKKNPREFHLHIPGRYLLLIVSLACIGLIFLTYYSDVVSGPRENTAGYLVVPFQNGISRIGGWILGRQELLEDMSSLRKENKELKKKNEELSAENTSLSQSRYALRELERLYELDQGYSEYEKTGARIIAKDTGNWYHSFVIDKGTSDGLSLDMNVLAGSGLVGRITAIGSDWARVETIIDDNINVAGAVLSTGDNLVVSGSLQLYADGTIQFVRLQDPENNVKVGDKIVTANISDKYLPDILIGTITSIQQDANNITKSGQITPAVDFAHLNTVLIIKQLKQKAPAGAQ